VLVDARVRWISHVRHSAFYTISPTVAKEILGAAYRVFTDSAPSRGEVDESESASVLQRTVAQLLRGAYW